MNCAQNMLKNLKLQNSNLCDWKKLSTAFCFNFSQTLRFIKTFLFSVNHTVVGVYIYEMKTTFLFKFSVQVFSTSFDLHVNKENLFIVIWINLIKMKNLNLKYLIMLMLKLKQNYTKINNASCSNLKKHVTHRSKIEISIHNDTLETFVWISIN